MRIGILGSGLMGGKLGTLFARAGHDVVFSYARSDQKLQRLAREAKGSARAGTPADAARDAILEARPAQPESTRTQLGVASAICSSTSATRARRRAGVHSPGK